MDSTALGRDNVAFSLLRSLSFTLTGGIGTESWKVELPVGCGLVIINAYGVIDDSAGVPTLSVDQFATWEWNNNSFASCSYFKKITDSHQTLTIQSDNTGTVTGTIHLYAVYGSDESWSFSDLIGPANTDYTTLLKRPGEGTLCIFAADSISTSQITGTKNNSWNRVFHAQGVASLLVQHRAAAEVVSYGTSVSGGFFEIVPKDKPRRKRFITREEVWTTQPPQKVDVIEKYRDNVMASWIAGVGNMGSFRNSSVSDIGAGGLIGYPGLVANNRTANDQWVVSASNKYGVGATTYIVYLIEDPLGYYTRAFVSYQANGNQRISYCPPGYEQNIGFGVCGLNYGDGTIVHRYYNNPDIRIAGKPVAMVCTWNKDKNGGYGRMWHNGVELPNEAGTPYTDTSNWLWSTAWQFGYDGNTKGVMAVILDVDVTPAEAMALSLNPWGIFARPRRTIFNGTPVITHKRRRVL